MNEVVKILYSTLSPVNFCYLVTYDNMKVLANILSMRKLINVPSNHSTVNYLFTVAQVKPEEVTNVVMLSMSNKHKQ